MAGGLALALVAGLVGWAVWPESKPYTATEARLTVLSGPGGDEPIELDTRFYLPADRSGPVPAVLLAHGFGGTKDAMHADAEDLAELGYAVLTWTARGFGRSGGEIHLNSPDHEVTDAARLLDWLAARPEVRQDASGDPRVGVVGGSYGGALALLLAGQDRRVDAIVPMITWNDLARSLVPESTGADPTAGVFKKGWAGVFFGSGTGGRGGLGALAAGGQNGGGQSGGQNGGDESGGESGGGDTADGTPGEPGLALPGAVDSPPADPACGRFARDVCDAYLAMATTGRPSAEAVALLRRSSPQSVLSSIKAPTLLIQGALDTLFPLGEADANARGIAATGTPVRVAWFTGGHDGGDGPQTDQDRVRFLLGQWLGHYVKGEGEAPANTFTWSRVAGFSALDRGLVANGYSVEAYPGLAGSGRTDVAVAGPPQRIANPPAGNPAALSSLPGLGGGLSDVLSGVAGDVAGQHARFVSEPLPDAIEVGGAPAVQIRAASPTGEATLFVKLYDIDPNGGVTLSGGLVAPVRLTGLPADIAQARPVTVTLPGIVRRIGEGNRLAVVVATSDQGFTTPAQPTTYTVALGAGPAGAVTLPTLTGEPIANPAVVWRYVLAGLIAAILLGLAALLLVLRARNRRRVDAVDPANGAGKTTTLRVLMGLTMPTAGEVRVFGYKLVPGSPVLSRLGALVEGPGFLPHLTGRENLRAYWSATGRPWADARFEEALEIAGLGDSVDRRTNNYSHGMKQRLAIAQAMLGLPELLVLDEPTDGLDPPQIAEMRRVLKRYATDGRAVLVSSHLLAEVEQTCTHAVVVNKGRIVASGPVEDIVGDSPSVQLDVSDPAAATEILQRLGVRSVTPDGAGLVVDMNGTPRTEMVAELVRAGIGVDRVMPRRRLEDAFLALVGDNSRGSGDR